MKEGGGGGRKTRKEGRREPGESVTKTKLWRFKKNLESGSDGLSSPFWELSQDVTWFTQWLTASLKKTR